MTLVCWNGKWISRLYGYGQQIKLAFSAVRVLSPFGDSVFERP